MVLDIDQFRPEKGGNPDKIRENQRLRFSDVSMVDKIVQADENWRKGSSLEKCFTVSLLKQFQLFQLDLTQTT